MTQRLDLEFIKPSPFILSSWSGFGVFILSVSLLIAFFTWQSYRSVKNAQSEITSKLNAFNHQSNSKKIPIKTIVAIIPPEKIKQVSEVVNALIMPWDALLSAVEESDMPDIALLSLEPNNKKQQLLLTGEAKNFQSILTYVNQLEAQRMLSEVYLQKHSVNEADASKPISFTIFALWHMVELE